MSLCGLGGWVTYDNLTRTPADIRDAALRAVRTSPCAKDAATYRCTVTLRREHSGEADGDATLCTTWDMVVVKSADGSVTASDVRARDGSKC